jgi:osmotically-inducible protein OsmY
MNLRENEVVGQVRQALAHDPKLDAPRITITMLGDALALSGVLDTQEEVLRAEQVARSAAPGVAIDNSLTVSMSQHGGNTYGMAGESRHHGWQNSELQPDAERRLMAAYDALRNPVGNVGVEVVNGIAHVQGSVATVKERLALISAVAETPGLKRVIADSLEVAPFGTADDIRLGNLAIEKLQAIAPDLSAQITLDVRNRSAFLIGSVRTLQDRMRAEDAVSEVPGIAQVHNDLRLYQDESSTDVNVQVEQEVRHALGAAGLPVPNIRVFYAGQVLALDGEVETPEQRQKAVTIAHEVLHRVTRGLHQVSDNLQINARQGHVSTPESTLNQPPHHATIEPVISLENTRGPAPDNLARHTPPIRERTMETDQPLPKRKDRE